MGTFLAGSGGVVPAAVTFVRLSACTKSGGESSSPRSTLIVPIYGSVTGIATKLQHLLSSFDGVVVQDFDTRRQTKRATDRPTTALISALA